jgi:hypothetical protein
MARNNQEPFPCRDCRFAVNWKHEESMGVFGECRLLPRFKYVSQSGRTDCFSGEPKVRRDCQNCAKVYNCKIYARLRGMECASPFNGWHCSDWKVKE